MADKTKEVGIRLSVKDKELVEKALKEVGAEGSLAFKKIAASAQPASVSVRALNAAISTTDTHLGRISGAAVFSGFIRGAASALLPAIGLASALQGASSALNEFGKIADDSKASGVTTDFLQETAYAAEMAGVGYDELSAALITFNKNAGLAEVGKGRMVSQLKALNPELLSSIMLATTQAERVRLAADAINSASGASEKAALATVLFGEAGSRMVEVFSGGSAALAETAAKARELGIVVDSELIQRAESLGDEFDTATKVMDLQFKQILIELAPFIVGTAQSVAGIARAVRDLWGALGESPGWKSLQSRTAPLGERSLAIIEEQIAAKRAALGSAEDMLSNPQWGIGAGGWFGTSIGAQEGIDSLRSEIAELEAAVSARRDPTQVDVNAIHTSLANTVSPQIFPPKAGNGSGVSGGGGRDAEAAKAIREAEQLMRRVQTASEEYTATLSRLDGMVAAGHITQDTYSRAVGDAALKLGDAAELTGDYTAAQAALDSALQNGAISEVQYTEAVEEMSRRRLEASNNWVDGIQLGLMRITERSRNVGSEIADTLVSGVQSFEDAWISAIDTGKFKWQDLAKQVLLDIARMSTRNLITGPISGLLSSLLGGVSTFMGGGSGAAPLQLGFQAGVGHQGATIGSSAVMRAVPASLFLNAPRHHSGTPHLKAGEVPFIGMEGEEIGWPDQLARKYGGSGTTIHMEQTNHISGSNLSEDQLLHVLEQNNKSLLRQVPGAVRKSMGQGYFG